MPPSKLYLSQLHFLVRTKSKINKIAPDNSYIWPPQSLCHLLPDSSPRSLLEKQPCMVCPEHRAVHRPGGHQTWDNYWQKLSSFDWHVSARTQNLSQLKAAYNLILSCDAGNTSGHRPWYSSLKRQNENLLKQFWYKIHTIISVC